MADDWLGRLNSATKYPPIETYHRLDPATGKLSTPAMFFGKYPVTLTEKVDGTSGRVVVMPDGDWFIGSREELLYARGDRIENPGLGIVPALLPLAPALPGSGSMIRVYFLEVYGYRIGGAAKQYTRDAQAVGYRLLDVAAVPLRVLDLVRSDIAGWRDRGGQYFFSEEQLTETALAGGIPLVPRLGTVPGNELPAGLADTERFLVSWLPETLVALDDSAGGQPEGIVLRSADRSLIAKARFQDYARALQPEQKSKKEKREHA
ncbi:MAG TPA: RNA ligase family protein [Trebonia sp.]|jgi:hypothetical protein